MDLMWLKKIAANFQKMRDSCFGYPVKKQKEYLAHFPEPKDELERSYFQYCCQVKMYGVFFHVILNLAALPFSLYLLLKYQKAHFESEAHKKCVFIRYDLSEKVVPLSLRKRYPDMLDVSKMENCLCKGDVAFLKSIFKRYPFSWLFWMKNIIKVSQYSAVILRYAPEAIVTCEEYSFTSSTMTKYCRNHGVRRINVMHGEKLFYMRDAFVSFDEFYVWSQEYINLFHALRAEKNQFFIETPPSLLFEKQGVIKSVDYTYYLQLQNGDELKCVVDAMKQLSEKGNKVVFRPHPRATPMEELTQLCSGSEIEIENNVEVSIQDSVLRSQHVISLYSTVLLQAYYNNVSIVIDDVSDPIKMEKLQETGFVMLQKPHQKLSELMEKR